MKGHSLLLKLFFSIVLAFAGSATYAQVILTEDSVYCGSLTTTLHATIIGDLPLSSGIVEDDVYAPTPYALGFTFNYYGVPYTQTLIGANGNLSFDLSLAGAYDPWPVSAALLGNSSVYNCICGPWCDIFVPAGGIITYNNDGIAPHRRFIVNFCTCAMFSCTSQWITCQMVLNETTDKIDVYVAHKTICAGWNGGHAIIGVQNATGTDAVAAPGRDWPAAYNCVDEAWEFTPSSSGTTYTVAPTTFSPVPYPTTMIYWYDSTTGAFIDSGSTLSVTALTGATYKCAALGCGDTSFSYIHVAPASTGVSIDSFFRVVSIGGRSAFTNPTQCGNPDGTITLKGHGMLPGSRDTVEYYYGGALQPRVVAIVASDSSITLSGLCAGLYSNFTITQGPCTSGPMGPVTLSNPVINISSVTVVNPDSCGRKGELILNGLYPGKSFTVNYSYGGVAQPPLVISSSGSGTVTMPNLCAGTYSNIVASFTGCDLCTTAPPAGPFTIANPPISISSMTKIDASICGQNDGSILLFGLYPGQTYTVSFDTNGVAVPSVTITASSTGTANITHLWGRDIVGIVYTNIVATFTTCSSCTTPPAGPISLFTPPPPPIHIISSTNPTQCGYCDGTITLRSTTPYSSDTINYLFNGVPATPVITYADRDSVIKLAGLCGGNYSGFSVKVALCLQYVPESVNLITPKLFATFDDNIHLGCHGDTVDFTNLSTSPGAIAPIPWMFRWNFGDSLTDSAASPMHIYYAQGTYTVTLIASDHVCSDDTTLVVSLIHPLKAGFSLSPDVLCQNGTVTFSDTSTGGISSYQWYFGNGASANTINASYTYKNSGVYNAMLVVGNTVPCWDTAKAIVQVDSQSNVRIVLTDSVLCRSTDVNFTGIYTSSGNTGVTFIFGDGDSIVNKNPVVHAYDATGIFTVTTNAYFRACRDTSATRVVHIYPQPVINLGAADTSFCAGSNPLVLADRVNTGTPGASWTWSNGQTGPQINVITPGVYTATINVDGCKSSYTVTVKNDCYLNIPNIFSPNGDGVNDYFLPRTLLSSGLISFNMNVYNRWGDLVYQSATLDGRGWDGKLNNTDEPAGVYVYVIDAEFRDGQKEHHQGNVTLIR